MTLVIAYIALLATDSNFGPKGCTIWSFGNNHYPC